MFEPFVSQLLHLGLVLLPVLLFLEWRLRRLEHGWRYWRGQHRQALETALQGQFEQFGAYHFVRDRLDLHQGLHFNRHWSASPDFLKLLLEQCLERRPGMILECGAGVSTLVLAACCRLLGAGQVVSLESDAGCAKKTLLELERLGLQDFARVLYAPLQPVPIGVVTYLWYDLEGWHPTLIDLLVIDGPPGRLQPQARYPAMPLLEPYLAPHACILLDDAARPDEQAIVQRWRRQWPGWRYDHIDLARGCARLQRP